MEAIIKSDIFFFIAGTSAIVLTVFWLILTGIIAWFAYKILKDIQSISSVINSQVKRTADDLDRTRESVSGLREKIRPIVMIFLSTILAKIIKPKKGRKKDKKENNGKQKKD